MDMEPWPTSTFPLFGRVQRRIYLRKAAKLRGMYIFREENGDFLATWLSDFGVETGQTSLHSFYTSHHEWRIYHITYLLSRVMWNIPY